MKRLVDPLLWSLMAQAVALVVLMPNRNWVRAVRLKAVWTVWLITLVVLLVLSWSATGYVLSRSLVLDGTGVLAQAPQWILVLGGGYDEGRRPKDDSLSEESIRRVITGVALLKQYPQAMLVMSGRADKQSGRKADHLGQLMADVAKRYGASSQSVMLEARSSVTREHPIEALRLPGMTRDTPIAVVSSPWHLRRAKQEFGRYFSQVAYVPSFASVTPMNGYAFVPSSYALAKNVTYLCEWVGIFWYRIVALHEALVQTIK